MSGRLVVALAGVLFALLLTPAVVATYLGVGEPLDPSADELTVARRVALGVALAAFVWRQRRHSCSSSWSGIGEGDETARSTSAPSPTPTA